MSASVNEVRSRDAQKTRGAILESAQVIFAARAYAEAGIRDITARASVNPALVSRYFGGKLGLYEAAIDAALDPRLITDLERENFGELIVERFTDQRQGRVNPLPIMLSGTSDSDAREVVLRLLRDRVAEPLAAWIGGPAATARAARLMIVATGFFTYRDQLPLEGVIDPLAPDLRRWLVDAFQAIVDS